MTNQQPPVFGSRPPHDSTQAMASSYGAQLPTHTGSGVGGAGLSGGLLGIVGAILAVVTVVGGYAIMRWMPDPAIVYIAFVAVSLVVLAVLALLAGRRNALAPFVAIALTLPFFTVLSAGFGLGQRIEESLGELFGTTDGSSGATFTFGDDEEDDDAAAKADDAVGRGDEGTSGNFTVVVKGVECSDTLAKAERNPDYDYTDETEQYADVEAPEGKQFCVVSSTWSNSAQEPDMIWSGFGKVVTSDGIQYAPTDEDPNYGRRLDEQAGNEGGNLNPGDTAEVRSVFTVPADVEVTHAITEGFGFDEPAVWFSLD